MPNAQANSDDLHAFADRLAHCAETVGGEVDSTAAAFSALGDTWQDEKRAQFEEVFSDLCGCIQRLRDACDDQVPYLHTLASRLEDYLNS